MNTVKTFFATCLIGVAASFAAGTLTPAGSGMKPAEILSHDVKVTINNGFAMTEVTQRFKNINDATVEAVYSFPVPKSASLSECQVLMGETAMNGEVVAKDKARQVYKEEKDNGRNAALAEKDGYQDFRFNIANLAAQAEATISFVYYQPLPVDTGTCRYVYPLEEGNTKDDAAASFWTRNDKPTGKTTIQVILRSAWPVLAVRAPNGNITQQQMNLENGTAQVTYELQDGLTRDFVFYYQLAENLPGRLEVIPYRKAGKDGTFMMVLTPGIDMKPIENGADYAFVLDCSGSMCGNKLQTLAKGVTQVLGKMNAKDRFRIIMFNHNANELTRGYTAATPENVAKYVEALGNVRSGGSTNLYAGLKSALTKLDSDRVTSIVLVTDGVTNTGEVNPKMFYNLLKGQDVRVFGFLMGNSSNWPLMRVICNASGGFYDAVSNDDDIIGKILLAKSKIAYESLHDVKVSISGGDVYDLTNDCPEKLYRGQQMVIFGRYKKAGRATVTMKVKISGREEVYKCDMDFPENDEANPELERLWALDRIEMFEDLANSGLQPAGECNDAIRNLGVEFQLVTDETSMIILSDEAHQRHNINRRNKDRVATERKAQSRRNALPVQNYRVDAPKEKKNDSGMFKFKAPRIPKGGGALDPWSLLLLGLFASIATALPKRNSKKD